LLQYEIGGGLLEGIRIRSNQSATTLLHFWFQEDTERALKNLSNISRYLLGVYMYSSFEKSLCKPCQPKPLFVCFGPAPLRLSTATAKGARSGDMWQSTIWLKRAV